MGNSKNVDVSVYYQNLTKKEKGKFLLYLSKRWNYNQRTMGAKLSKGSELRIRTDERENLITAIANEQLWKN